MDIFLILVALGWIFLYVGLPILFFVGQIWVIRLFFK